MKFLRSLLAGLGLSILTAGAALAQCGTTAPANKFCGNDTGSSALATWKTIPASALTAIAGGTLLGNPTGASAVPVATAAPVLGIPGTSTGQVGLAGATSGTAILRAQAAAGSAVSLLPTSAGTLVSTASSPLVINSTTGLISVTQSALTRTNDTNVTMTLGGSPSTALLAATSLTLGWTGQLSAARGGTGIGSYTLGDMLYASGASALSALAGNITTAKQYLSQTGTGTVSAAPAWATIAGSDITGAALTSSNDTNVTITLGGTPATSLLRAASLTMGWSGTLAVARGGTGGGTASGTLLDNISGFSGTGYLQRTGAGAYSFTATTAVPLTVGTSPVNGGTTTRVLFDNAGVLGEYSISGSGSVAMTTSPAFTTPNLGTPSAATLTNATGLPIAGISGLGTNVATALGNATGSPNGFPRIIASGTIALGTGAISAGTCGSAATAVATSALTTDVIDVGFSADPTGTTGYTPSAMLTLVIYPTANTVNVKQCNLTAASITPGALSLNWWIRR